MTMTMMTTTMGTKISHAPSATEENGGLPAGSPKDGGENSCRTPVPVAVVITAAGASTRMGGQKKEYRRMPRREDTVLSAATEPFVAALAPSALPTGISRPEHIGTAALPFRLTQVVITIPPNSGATGLQAAQNALFASLNLRLLWHQPLQPPIQSPALMFVEGSDSRQASVLRALQALAENAGSPTGQEEPEIVLIHDGARPFVTEQIILQVAEAAMEHGAAACGIPPVDTQKEVDSQGIIVRHLERDSLAAVQTPQGFRFKPLLEAHRLAAEQKFDTTDDAAIWGKYVGTVQVTQGSADNKKITFPGDLPSENPQQGEAGSPHIRTGLGYDLHRLEEGRPLVLGGVAIPFHKGEAGHSDGDALLHAITDALLGAAARSDIGELFPPSDLQWKDADSRKLLRAAWSLVAEAGWKLVNLDCVVAIQQPKIQPHRTAIRKSIAAILEVDEERVFIKAKTGEKLGPVGNSEAVEVWATCLLSR